MAPERLRNGTRAVFWKGLRLPFDERIRYGTDPRQFAELRYPKGKGPFPLLFVVHDGFWQSAYDLKHIGALCASLTSHGIITCNLEYRRLGDPGGGYPGTFQDIGQTCGTDGTASQTLPFQPAQTLKVS